MKIVKYSRMQIGEANSEKDATELARLAEESNVGQEPGFLTCQVLTETDGGMVVILTTWETEKDCLMYASSRSYRQFLTMTQHLTIGDYVVKFFEERQTTGVAA